MTVWVVIGSTGEFSDRSEWPVVAYADETTAQQHVELATRRANEIQVMRESDYEVPEGVVNDYDPLMSMDYTGTSYFLWRVPVATHLNGSGAQ